LGVSDEEGVCRTSDDQIEKTMGDEPWAVQPAASDSGDASVPPDVLAAAYRAIDARAAGDVLPLAFDSLLGERRSALGGTRQLRFGGDDPHVEIALQETGPELAAAITVVPPGELVICVRHGGGTATVPTDGYGRGSIGIQHGPLSVVFDGVDGRAVETAWVNV
jgi:hypothetical protein